MNVLLKSIKYSVIVRSPESFRDDEAISQFLREIAALPLVARNDHEIVLGKFMRAK